MARSLLKMALVLAAFGLSAPAGAHCHPGHGDEPMPPPPPATESLIEGEFSLTDVKTDQRVERSTYDGQWRLVFFGFTKCTYVCPTGLALMGRIMGELDAQGVSLVPMFITVDPERDTPEVMRTYLEYFDERIVGLYGSRAEIDAAMASFRIEAPKVEIKSSTEYQLDHPGLMMLMDPEGAYLLHIPSEGDAKELAGRLVGAIGH